MDYRILPSEIMNIAGIWTMIMMMVNAWSIEQFRRRKELIGFAIGIGTFIGSFILFEIENLSYHLLGYGKTASPEFAAVIPSRGHFTIILICVSIISVAVACHHMYIWFHTVSESSISFCVDSIPVGICYYRENGRILLTNACMKRICYEYIGKALLNAFDFTENVSGDYITLKDNSIWKVEQKCKSYEDGIIYELICTDVSELVVKKQNLEEKNKEVAALNEKLRSYQLDIDELIRKKEILKAKMDIHDEMNSLMLMTVAALDADDEKMLDEAMAEWNQNAGLVVGENRRSANELKNVEELSEMLGITIAGKESVCMVPKEYMELYCIIARESLINASKHSKATTVTTSVVRDDALTFIFENDEVMSCDLNDIDLTGGLYNIKRLVTEQGGEITAHVNDGKFILNVTFPEYH